MESIDKAKKYLICQSTYLGVSALLTFSSFIGIIALQSSINIVEELGTTSLAITYGTTMVFNLTLTAFVVKRLGPKYSLIVADILYIFYTVANIFPSYGLLITAAFFLGIAQGIVWCEFPVFNTFFGREYSNLVALQTQETKTIPKDFGAYVRRFAGRFFAIFSAYLIIGNISSFIILQFDDDSNTIDSSKSNFFNETTMTNHLSVAAGFLNETYDFAMCGSNQCGGNKKLSIDSKKEEKYIIKNWNLKLALFVFYGTLQLVALLIHIFLLNDTKRNKIPKLNSSKQQIFFKNNDVKCIDCENNPDEEKNKSNEKWYQQIPRYFIEIMRQLALPQQLLIIPLNFHFGLMMAFAFADITRSFVSCISGVQQVGIVMTVLGVCEIIFGLVVERLGARLGRNLFFAISYASEFILLLFCLFWPPSGAVWVPYFIIVLFGITDGLRQPLLSATVMEHFSDKKEIAFCVMSLLTGMGSSLSYFSSGYLCVNEKLYILLSTSVVSAICLFWAEKCFKNSAKI